MQCPIDHASVPRSPTGCPVSADAAAFDPFSAQYQQNPGAMLQWARDQEPVFYSPTLGYWVVTRYDEVRAVFRDNLLFSPSIALEKITPPSAEAAAILKSYGYAMNRTMVNEDEPDHMQRRRLLLDAFLPEALAKHEPAVRALATRYIDRLIDKGRADLVAEMFYEVPLTIALHFLGVPDEGAEQLRRFAVAHTINTWGRPTPEEQLRVAENVGKFWQTAQKILADMRANPTGDGWMFETIRQHQLHPEVVTESYLQSMMMAILAAAHETTSNATANAFLTLLSERSKWEEICANPALIPNAVEECLRVAGSIIAWRRIATADTRVGGVDIPKGGKLLLVQASANFDERHFENPNEVDLYRENSAEHLTFGYGAHQCMGKNIGRMEMRVFLEEFTRRLPHLRLAPGQRFDYLLNTSFRGPTALWVEWDPLQNPERQAGAALTPLLPFRIGAPVKEDLARTLVLKEKRAEGEPLFRLLLADPQGRPLPAWSAGAHVDLMAGGYRRKYSLCGDPADRSVYQLVLLREAEGRGGSRYFCDTLQAGDPVRIAGPKNLFRLVESAPHTILLAGGIGITPILAMADRLRLLGRSYRFHYAGKRRSGMALLERALRDHAGALQLHVGEEGQRMDLGALLADLAPGTQIYACGPARLIEALQALEPAWPEGTLHFEHFAQAGNDAVTDASQQRPFVAELQDSGLRVSVAPGQTLLQALQAAGVDVPCDCGEGLCGTCEVAVAGGTPEHHDSVLSKAERASGRRMMACCSRAVGEKIVLAL